jgi:tRNA modification GTPase
MDLRWDDTIAALASPPGPGPRGILRLTGPNVVDVLKGLFHADWPTSRQPGRYPGSVFWPECRAPIAADLQLWPTRRSYTGQPLAELHLVSSPPLLEGILAELYRRGARPARPGEFTLRAFLAGRLDLLQAEAVLGVIDAHDDVELRTALEQLAGGISHELTALRSDLLNLLADLEAGLDFVEEHLEFVTRAELHARLAAARVTVERLQAQAAGRMHSGDRPRVVLAGLPNAGKSTLFNALLGRSQALVSPIAGTTRDYLTAAVTWNGQTLDLIDTAGFDDFATGIDGTAQELRHDQWRRADLTVWCSAADLSAEDRVLDDARYASAAEVSPHCLRINTKVDAGGVEPLEIAVSAVTQTGLDALRDAILHALSHPHLHNRHWLGSTAARCQDSLQSAAAALRRAEKLSSRSPGIAIPGSPSGDEFLAVDLRDALDHLGEIVGAVYTNDLLDRIFSRFCIGK